MKVYKLKLFDSEVYFKSLSSLMAMAESDVRDNIDVEGETEITISLLHMTEEEFSELPEFEGY